MAGWLAATALVFLTSWLSVVLAQPLRLHLHPSFWLVGLAGLSQSIYQTLCLSSINSLSIYQSILCPSIWSRKSQMTSPVYKVSGLTLERYRYSHVIQCDADVPHTLNPKHIQNLTSSHCMRQIQEFSHWHSWRRCGRPQSATVVLHDLVKKSYCNYCGQSCDLRLRYNKQMVSWVYLHGYQGKCTQIADHFKMFNMFVQT